LHELIDWPAAKEEAAAEAYATSGHFVSFLITEMGWSEDRFGEFDGAGYALVSSISAALGITEDELLAAYLDYPTGRRALFRDASISCLLSETLHLETEDGVLDLEGSVSCRDDRAVGALGDTISRSYVVDVQRGGCYLVRVATEHDHPKRAEVRLEECGAGTLRTMYQSSTLAEDWDSGRSVTLSPGRHRISVHIDGEDDGEEFRVRLEPVGPNFCG
jgi:hypothetical protein